MLRAPYREFTFGLKDSVRKKVWESLTNRGAGWIVRC